METSYEAGTLPIALVLYRHHQQIRIVVLQQYSNRQSRRQCRPPLGLAAGRGGGDTAHSPWRALVTAFRHGQEAECSVLAGVDNDLPAGECATRPRSSGAPSGCVAPCHTACLTHTRVRPAAVSRIVWRACPGVRRRIATPGARCAGARQGEAVAREASTSERRRPARGACGRGLQGSAGRVALVSSWISSQLGPGPARSTTRKSHASSSASSGWCQTPVA